MSNGDDAGDDLSDWGTSNVTNMNGMFDTAHDFNQNLPDGIINKVVDHSGFADPALSPDNIPKCASQKN